MFENILDILNMILLAALAAVLLNVGYKPTKPVLYNKQKVADERGVHLCLIHLPVEGVHGMLANGKAKPRPKLMPHPVPVAK